MLDQVGGHAAGVAVAHAGHPQVGAAAGALGGEHVGVEQLAGAHHRVAYERRGDAGQRGVALGLVAVAPTVHQVGGPRGAHVGVVERLEHGGRGRGEVGAVHVVDGVGQLAGDAEALGGAEAGAILDVAMLLAVKPVHAGDLVALLADAGDDRGGAHGGDRRKRGNAVGHVATAGDEPLEHGSGTAGDRPLEHRRGHRVDDAEDELGRAGAHRSSAQRRRMRRPAYFSSPRPRPRQANQASATTTT